jgi:hypothetical protein
LTPVGASNYCGELLEDSPWKIIIALVNRLDLLIFIIGGAGLLSAQSNNVYLFAGPGAVTSAGVSTAILHGGVGFEIRLPVGLAAGAEVGVLTSVERTGAVGIGSLNGYYHFMHDRSRKLDPFATAGYTALVSDGLINAFNVGGGVNWWFVRHVGLKLEFRDHITQVGFSFVSSHASETIQLPEFRVGIAFR